MGCVWVIKRGVCVWVIKRGCVGHQEGCVWVIKRGCVGLGHQSSPVVWSSDNHKVVQMTNPVDLVGSGQSSGLIWLFVIFSQDYTSESSPQSKHHKNLTFCKTTSLLYSSSCYDITSGYHGDIPNVSYTPLDTDTAPSSYH